MSKRSKLIDKINICNKNELKYVALRSIRNTEILAIQKDEQKNVSVANNKGTVAKWKETSLRHEYDRLRVQYNDIELISKKPGRFESM